MGLEKSEELGQKSQKDLKIMTQGWENNRQILEQENGPSVPGVDIQAATGERTVLSENP